MHYAQGIITPEMEYIAIRKPATQSIQAIKSVRPDGIPQS
jgi:hypothetical protein